MSRTLKALVPLALFIGIAVFLFKGLGMNPREIPSPLIGKPLPQFELPRLLQPEQTLSNSDLLGKVSLVNVWATWCVSCRAQHGELMKLGFVVPKITVTRYMPRRPTEPARVKRWMAFLRNHKDAIAAMDFFTVPTVSLRVLYVLFVIEHGRRRIVHVNVTSNPTSAWVIQQLREAFPYDTAPRHLIFDRDTIFSPAVVRFVRAMGTKPARTAYRCPWQKYCVSYCTS